MSEVTKEWFNEGYERGVAAERANTEKERTRADAAEEEARKLREELEALRKSAGKN